jgi:hypothetical protein
LLHATKEDFKNALINLSKLLKSGGVFSFTLKKGEGNEISEDKVGGPRFFQYYSKEEVEDILNKIGLYEVIDFEEMQNGKWLGFTLRKI